MIRVNTITILYWITTGLVALLMLGSATFYIVKHDMVVENMKHLGYPTYLVNILPFTKVLGAGLLLIGVKGIPSNIWRNLNEWVYSALFCNCVLAAIAHGNAGDGWINPGTIASVILVSSYFLSKKVGS
ncbi:MAG: DoxX family protein [Bacteroidetes bacterium]|nr:DoxX family protein [Bacteroidota bacterium]